MELSWEIFFLHSSREVFSSSELHGVNHVAESGKMLGCCFLGGASNLHRQSHFIQRILASIYNHKGITGLLDYWIRICYDIQERPLFHIFLQ